MVYIFFTLHSDRCDVLEALGGNVAELQQQRRVEVAPTMSVPRSALAVTPGELPRVLEVVSSIDAQRRIPRGRDRAPIPGRVVYQKSARSHTLTLPHKDGVVAALRRLVAKAPWAAPAGEE